MNFDVPGTGMVDVVVDVVEVDVVVSVIVTLPGPTGSPLAQAIARRGREPSSAAGRSLRILHRQVERHDRSDLGPQTVIVQRRQGVERQQQLSFEVQLEPGREHHLADAFGQGDG